LFEPNTVPPDRGVPAASKELQHGVNASPKPRRSNKIILTGVDKRTALGKRIVELKALFVEALGGVDAISAIKRMKVDEAAQLKALAELCRGDFMRDAKGNLDDIVRIERKAEHAVRALRIVEAAPKPPSLRDYITAKHGAGSDNEAVADNGADQDAEPPA